jgi:hypothetical protein
MVRLSILCTYKFKARNPHKIGNSELFVTPTDKEKIIFPRQNTARQGHPGRQSHGEPDGAADSLFRPPEGCRQEARLVHGKIEGYD